MPEQKYTLDSLYSYAHSHFKRYVQSWFEKKKRLWDFFFIWNGALVLNIALSTYMHTGDNPYNLQMINTILSFKFIYT